jgi:RNA recognition motif-containing protein
MSGQSRGFAFVTMGNRHEGQAAINALGGQLVDGRKLTVNEARPKTQHHQDSLVLSPSLGRISAAQE